MFSGGIPRSNRTRELCCPGGLSGRPYTFDFVSVGGGVISDGLFPSECFLQGHASLIFVGVSGKPHSNLLRDSALHDDCPGPFDFLLLLLRQTFDNIMVRYFGDNL